MGVCILKIFCVGSPVLIPCASLESLLGISCPAIVYPNAVATIPAVYISISLGPWCTPFSWFSASVSTTFS